MPHHPKIYIRLVAVALGAVLTFTAAGQDRATQTEATTAPASKLTPVPHPDLSELEADVSEQLGKMRSLLQAVMDDSNAGAEDVQKAFFELGRIYHAYGFEEAAAASYLNALRLHPRDFEALYLRGVVQQQQGNLGEADASFQAALEQRPDYLAGWVRMAEIYREENRTGQARRFLQRALQLDPGCTAARAGLGEVALAEQDYEQAIKELEQALAEVPDANRLRYPLALAYRGLGNTDEARQQLARRGKVGVKPPDPLVEELEALKRGERVHLLRGHMAFGAGRYREAAEAFAEAVAARPESARAHVNLGTALGMMGERAGAKAQFREALKYDPDNDTAHFNLGSYLAQEGADAEAVDHLRAALVGDSSDLQAHLDLARVLRRSGQGVEARGHYARAVGIDPLNEEARFGEASVLVDEGRYAEAVRLLEEAYQVMPQEGRIVHALARLLAACPALELRDGERALTLARSVFEATNSPGHAATMAMALAETGRCNEAAELQGSLVEATEKAGEAARAEGLRATLARYQAGPPCRPPGGQPPVTPGQ